DRGDRITDFEVGADLLDFGGVFELNRYGSSTPFDDYIRVSQGNGRSFVQVDLNGDFGRRDRFRTFATLSGVTATDLTVDSFVL
ncbi:MAG: type I secretion C-terminal target domain-containing protein, partial [Cyanobacteria bacterium J06588_5]